MNIRTSIFLICVSVLPLAISACGKSDPTPKVTQSAAVSNNLPEKGAAFGYAASLEDGIDFSKPGYPAFIKEVKGMSALEPKGRWTDGASAIFVFKEAPQGKVRIEISALPYGANAGKSVQLLLGGQQREVVFTNPNDFQTASAEFDLAQPAETLEIRVPQPTVPPGGDRHLGLFIGSLKFKPVKP